MRLTLLIAFIFASCWGVYFFPGWKDQIIFVHEASAEVGLVFILLLMIVQTNRRRDRISLGFLCASFVCALVADTLYNLRIAFEIGNERWIANSSQILYSAFLLFLLIFVIYKVSRHSRDIISVAVILLIGGFYAYLSFKYILIPYYFRPSTPAIFNIINSTCYGIFGIILIGFVSAYSLRTNKIIDHWFTQGIVLLLIFDFAIRYQGAFVNESEFSITELGWSTSLALFFVVVLESYRTKAKLLESEIASYVSVRSLLTVAISGTNLIFLIGILFMRLHDFNNAFDLTKTLFCIYIVWLFANLLSLVLSRDLISLQAIMFSQSASSEAESAELLTVKRKAFIFEINQWIQGYNRLVEQTNYLVQKTIGQRKQAAVGELASQVAHDIRSPLAALDMVTRNIEEIPEEKRLILRTALGRIRDIANHLVNVNRLANKSQNLLADTHSDPSSVQLVGSLLDSIVTEKRIQFRIKSLIEIEYAADEESYGLFAKLQPVEFKRVVSNLIDNSVEAMDDKIDGRISVSLKSDKDSLSVVIRDNGKGIPASLIPMLGLRGETFGKVEGSGLGLYHAKKCLESWSGKLNIASQEGVHTTITLEFPKAVTPAWFVPSISIQNGQTIVILDDEHSIHQIWKDRFSQISNKTTILSFYKSESLRSWVQTASDSNIIYLCDYELFGSGENGIQLIESLGIQSQAILVTSRYEDPSILEHCNRLGLRLIPKPAASLVRIRL